MSAPKRIALALLIALIVLLPLYELVDIGEQWPHDGSVVLVLFSALCLIGAAILCRGLAQVCAICLRRVLLPPPDRPVDVLRALAAPGGRSLLFLILCLLRI